jgi:hypothetical protein
VKARDGRGGDESQGDEDFQPDRPQDSEHNLASRLNICAFVIPALYSFEITMIGYSVKVARLLLRDRGGDNSLQIMEKVVIRLRLDRATNYAIRSLTSIRVYPLMGLTLLHNKDFKCVS